MFPPKVSYNNLEVVIIAEQKKKQWNTMENVMTLTPPLKLEGEKPPIFLRWNDGGDQAMA